MTLDPVLLERQVERQRRGDRRNQGVVLLYALVAFGAVSFVFASVARVPFPTRLWVAALGGVIGAVVTVVGVRVVQAVGERSMMAVLEPGGRGRDTAVYSHA